MRTLADGQLHGPRRAQLVGQAVLAGEAVAAWKKSAEDGFRGLVLQALVEQARTVWAAGDHSA